jgi:precorrin-6B methylase 2
MTRRYAARLVALSTLVSFLGSSAFAQATQPGKPFEPYSGQPGKDVVWVPTPEPLVQKMLDMAKITPQDFHMDLGSGDGRTVIAAAKRGARSQGIEYNPDMVELSKQNATKAGVSDRATFVKADLFETDFSKAQVITLFLLPTINMRLRPQILNMRPGTRIVSNTFTMEDWQADKSETIENCTSWCTALLWIVPAKVDGAWQLGSNTMTITQEFQNFTGSVGSNAIANGKLNGAEISFAVGNQKYTGRVDGNTMSGTVNGGGTWKATKR